MPIFGICPVEYIKSRNPVFALEMIQTDFWTATDEQVTEASQSSIRPGDDSDKEIHHELQDQNHRRNPVFALEMIQTKDGYYLLSSY